MSLEDIEDKKIQIKLAMSEDKNNNFKDKSSQQMSMGNLKNFFQRKYPNESEEEIMVRTL